jgi:hypothetical protein
MSTPSRADIRSRLRQAVQQLEHMATRVTRRVPPVWQDAWRRRSSHQAYLTPDYGMCCYEHQERLWRD